ncbi:hypothetical protein ANABIO32_43070 [Rossellomorea marisflavi]|nr:hypothetical protein ANABIO32_43070 [Rossellomorea marisflavi]
MLTVTGLGCMEKRFTGSTIFFDEVAYQTVFLQGVRHGFFLLEAFPIEDLPLHIQEGGIFCFVKVDFKCRHHFILHALERLQVQMGFSDKINELTGTEWCEIAVG